MNRQNFLKEQEKIIQKKWNRNAFEADAPDNFDPNNKKKFFVTFPYPYSNASQHIGHVFTLLKADIMARHYRTKGYNVLFPFAHHGSGIPISVAANKLKEELESNHPGKQHEIMKRMDIDPEEIPKFVDPKYWIKYFSKIALEKDLPSLGCAIDYRRSFITTDLNPYYDSFVKWQFNKLNEKGYLKFGKKMVIYSEKDSQPCSDADRASGEGVEIRELKVVFVRCKNEKYDEYNKNNKSKKYSGYFVTYDPEAPSDRIIKSKNLKLSEYLIHYQHNYRYLLMTEHFYNNYNHQPNDRVPFWTHCNPNNRWVDINNSPDLDYFSCMEETDMIHGSGFYTSDLSFNWKLYFEPESEVISRSGDKCIVAETDQWYIMYDNPEWQRSVHQYVNSNVKFTDPAVKNLILDTILKSHPWPFSRTFGMGTKIPFDEKYLIDSLSDSTIYMAYYTIAHLITQLPIDKLSDSVWDSIFLEQKLIFRLNIPIYLSK